MVWEIQIKISQKKDNSRQDWGKTRIWWEFGLRLWRKWVIDKEGRRDFKKLIWTIECEAIRIFEWRKLWVIKWRLNQGGDERWEDHQDELWWISVVL